MRATVTAALISMLLTGFSAHHATAQDRPIAQRIVHYTTSDGLKANAVLMYPDTGMNLGAPVIVMHHGGPGGHAARTIGAYRFAAERFATAGYTVLSPVSRHSSGYYKYVLQDSTTDIAASLDFVEGLGFTRIVLMGHSMGSIRITRYMTLHNHPRVKAMVHFAPTADTYDFVGKRPEVAPIIEQAQQAVMAGKDGLNLYPDSVDPDPTFEPPVMLATGRGRLQTPEVLLSWWGPGYPSANSALFPQLTVPQLLLGGTDDPPTPPGRLEQLADLAVNSPKVDYIWYEGGDHYFTFHQDESAADTVAWLASLGLEPGPLVTTALKDTRLNRSFTPDGARVPYPGVQYKVAGTDRAASPLMIYVYGQGQQIFEEPLHRLALLMASKGYEGHAPQLRESGFRGSLTSTIDRQAEDIRDVLSAHRQEGRRVVFVGYREGILWAMEAVKAYDIADVAGFVALSPPPDLPAFAKTVLGDERYEDAVTRSQDILAASDSQTFIVEKYFRPPPAVPGSTDAFMLYPETFLDYYGPDSKAVFADYARAADAPLLMIAGSEDTSLDGESLEQLERLSRSRDKDMRAIDGANASFEFREEIVADVIAGWLKN